MSVTMDDPKKLPKHRRPQWLGGEGRDPLFQMWSGKLPEALALVPDKEQRDSLHACVTPRQATSFEAYQAALHGTRDKWQESR
ncbi:MAG: hypothetical protein ACQEXJ_25070 [Myxococcota bacterium]